MQAIDNIVKSVESNCQILTEIRSNQWFINILSFSSLKKLTSTRLDLEENDFEKQYNSGKKNDDSDTLLTITIDNLKDIFAKPSLILVVHKRQSLTILLIYETL